MRTASLVLGIIGGVFGIIAGFLALTVGGIGSAFQAQGSHEVAGLGFVAILIAIVGIVGGALAPKNPELAALLEGISGIAGFVAVSMFWIFSGPLLLVGALLAFLSRQPKAAALDLAPTQPMPTVAQEHVAPPMEQRPRTTRDVLTTAGLSVAALIAVGIVIFVVAAALSVNRGTAATSGGTDGTSSSNQSALLPTPTAAQSGHTVRYLVTLSNAGGHSDITYDNTQGGTEQIAKNLGAWDKTFTGVKTGETLYVSAQNDDAAGDVSCAIFVDGKAVKSSHSSGGYTIATCSTLLGLN